MRAVFSDYDDVILRLDELALPGSGSKERSVNFDDVLMGIEFGRANDDGEVRVLEVVKEPV